MRVKLFEVCCLVFFGLSVQIGASEPDNAKQLYERRCAVCHQSDGQGLRGMVPTLTQNPKALGGVDSLVRHVYGIGLDTARYQHATKGPTLRARMTHAEMALVLSYIRSTWGNKGKAVSVADVAKSAK